MRSIFKSAAVVCAGGLMLAAAACNSGGKISPGAATGDMIRVPLVFQPTSELAGTVSLPTGKPKIFVKPVSDDRTDKSALGHNTENAPIPVVVDTGSPDQFVHDGLIAELHKVCIDTVNSADAADRVIDVSLKSFTADEGGTYKGQILAIVQVTDKAGKVVFNKSVSGESSTWGHSKEPANYQQVLSNSVVDMTSSLLSTNDFAQALSVSAH